MQAGSLFVWCQSAAMGGAAVNGIIAAGASGAGVAGTAAAAAEAAGGSEGAGGVLGDDIPPADIDGFREVFGRVFRRGL